ncbi:MAG: ester cyclase [Bacteroidia bacterium]
MTAKAIAKAWFNGIDSRNFEGVKKLMAPNHKFHNPMSPQPIEVEEHIGMMQMMTSAFEGKHHIDQLIEDGNHVVARGHWSGKHVGEFNGVPATGNDLTFSWMDLFEIVDGKVANEYFEMNPLSIMSQIGAMETKDA